MARVEISMLQPRATDSCSKSSFSLKCSVHGIRQGRRVYFRAVSGHDAALLWSKGKITRLWNSLLFVSLFTLQTGWGVGGWGLCPGFKCLAQDYQRLVAELHKFWVGLFFCKSGGEFCCWFCVMGCHVSVESENKWHFPHLQLCVCSHVSSSAWDASVTVFALCQRKKWEM